MTDALPADWVDILKQTNIDVIDLGRHRAFTDALALLDKACEAVAEERSDEWMRGFDEGRHNVHCEQPLHPEYAHRVKPLPEDLDYDPTNLLEVLGQIDQEGWQLGIRQAIEAGRAQRDTENGPPLLEDYAADPDDPDAAEVEEYQERADYIAGLQFVPDTLVEGFGIDPDPDWVPQGSEDE